MKLHYQKAGEGDTLVIIHGLFGSADNWRSMAKYFSKTHQVISVDLRNHGRSPHSQEQDFTLMAEDIHQLCSDLSLSRITLLGHSLGGKVAMQFAMLYPNLVDKLIIVDIAMRQYFSQHTPLMDAMMALDLRQYSSRNEADEALSSAISDTAVRQFFLINLIVEEGELAWRINLHGLKIKYPNLMASVCEDVQISVPSLFIYGGLSDYVTEADRVSLPETFSQAEFVCIENASHWVQAERPQEFKRVVEGFLQR